ncbi:MAG: hypothetical protein K0S32_947 [Bacteroidetes bacterium]|jgi:uncharacterized coiled-coil protein SlyX|nr:hypothetical protein [Bacteroidota bacterium]
MKKITILALAFLTACATSQKEKEGLEARYNHRMDSITNLMAMQDSAINEFISSFNEIELNLDSVAKKQNVISMELDKSKGELRGSAKIRINSQIEAINAIMDKNEAKITELNRRLKNSNVNIKEFKKTISLLNDQILEKNTEMEVLNGKLAIYRINVVLLQVAVDTLSGENYEKTKLIEEQTNVIHTAYYIVGKTKELSEKKIIDKSGGLLGIGKSKKLSEEFDTQHFSKIDYTQTLTIPIYSKKAKLITTHPFDSYILDKDNNKFTQMRIINPDKFWSASKYLVVATN